MKNWKWNWRTFGAYALAFAGCYSIGVVTAMAVER